MAISPAKRNRKQSTGGSSMRRNAALAAAIAAILSLGGCSLFGSDKAEEAETQAVPADPYVPIATVRNIEVGRTRNGIAITAFGIAPGLGFGAPELRVRRDGKPGPDGLLDFDFVARAPDANFNLGEGPVAARAVRADALLSPRQLEGVRGIRIHGASGGLQMLF
jgi:hypothetical protein